VFEQLELIPANLKAIRTIRLKYNCAECNSVQSDDRYLWTAIGGLLASSELSYCAGGVETVTKYLVQVFHKHVMSANKLHADAKHVMVLKASRSSSRTAPLRNYVVTDMGYGGKKPRAVWFALTLVNLFIPNQAPRRSQ
jgi:hypothetical protein